MTGIDDVHVVQVEPTVRGFRWRAIVIAPRFTFERTWGHRLRIAYGWDIFFGKVPVLKVALLVNALVTFGIVRAFG
jgi:hypothetical protein